MSIDDTSDDDLYVVNSASQMRTDPLTVGRAMPYATLDTTGLADPSAGEVTVEPP